MKPHPAIAPVNGSTTPVTDLLCATRRQLLRGIPLGLLAAVPLPLSLLGCGGSDSSAPASGRAPFGSRSIIAITVTPPDGLDLAGTQAGTFFSSAAVASNGSAQVTVMNGGSQFTTLSSASGDLLLLGWISAQRKIVSTRTSVEVAMYLSLGGFLLPTELREAFIDELQARTDLDAVEDAITHCVLGKGKLDLNDTAVTAAMSNLRTSLMATAPAAPFGGVHTHSVIVEPGGQVSGLSVLNEGLDQIRIQNVFRRRSVCYIARTSYKMPDSAEQPVQPVEIFWTGEIPPMTMSTTLTTTIVNALADWSTGSSTLVDNYTSSYNSLPLNPDNAEYTVYTLGIAGLGATAGTEPAFWGSEQQWAHTVTGIKTLAFDMLLPLIINQIIPTAVAAKIPTPFGNETYGESLTAIATFANAVLYVAPDIASVAETDMKGALLKLADALINDSTTQTAFLLFVYNYAVCGAAAGGAQKALYQLLPDIDAEEFVGKAGSVFAIMQWVNIILGAADLGLWAEGILKSNTIDHFDVTIGASQLTLSPGSSNAQAGDIVSFTAKLKDKPSNPDALVTYRFTLSGNAGGTLRNANGLTGNSVTSASGSIDYVAADDAREGKQDQVKVEALLTDVTAGANNSVIATSDPSTVTIASNNLKNGDFTEGLNYWTIGHISGGNVGVNQESDNGCNASHHGQPCAYLDVWSYQDAYIQQSFTVPRSATHLTLDCWGWLEPVTFTVSIFLESAEDVLDVFTPTPLETLSDPNDPYSAVCSGAGPMSLSYGIKNYAGKTVTLRLRAKGGAGNNGGGCSFTAVAVG